MCGGKGAEGNGVNWLEGLVCEGGAKGSRGVVGRGDVQEAMEWLER